MAKRTIEDLKIEDSKIDFKEIRKRKDSKIKEIDQNINISEHEVHKFTPLCKQLIQSRIKKRLTE